MVTDAQFIALIAECEGLRRQLELVRAEDSALRPRVIIARHHLVQALRALTGVTTMLNEAEPEPEPTIMPAPTPAPAAGSAPSPSTISTRYYKHG